MSDELLYGIHDPFLQHLALAVLWFAIVMTGFIALPIRHAAAWAVFSIFLLVYLASM